MVKKASFTTIFTALSLVIVLFITLAISSIFYYNIRNITHRQIVANTDETMKLLKSKVLETLRDYTNLIRYTNSGVSSLFRINNDVPRNIMQDYLRTNKNNVLGVEWVYFSNNIKWNEPGGYFALNEEWIPDDDYDQTERPWFTVAKEAGGEVAYLEPFVDATAGSLNIAMSMIALDTEGQDIGVVSLEICVDSLVSLVQGDGTKDKWLLDKAGLFITHSDINAVMTKNFFTEMGLEKYKTQVLSANDNLTIEDKEILLYVAPISEADWYLVSIVSKKEIFAEANWLITFTGLILGLLLVISTALLIIITKRMVAPLRNAAKTFVEISIDWDLTKRLDLTNTGGIAEIHDIAEGFNLTFKRICELIQNINKEADELTGIGNDLDKDMTEAAAAINKITDNIQSIKGRMINQSAGVTETNSTMEQITVNINKLNSHVEIQSSSVAQSSSAIEQMLANISSVTQTLIKNADNVNELTSASEVGRFGLQDVAADIQEIARESEGLLEINSVMENIASQTNLLSMNAAIEAAHAGEAGKGFAVVADEIRKLAESSSEQSKTISMVLKKIKSSIDKITSSTDNVLNKFEAIDTGVKTVAEQEENIRNAMEEQSQGSKQVLQAISNVNETTHQVMGVSKEMLDGAKEVIREGDNLEKTTQEITEDVNEMAFKADEVNTSVIHINGLSSKNRELIDLLTKQVSRFKVE